MWSIAFSVISSFFGSKKNLFIMLLVAIVSFVMLGLWADYQNTKRDAALYKERYQQSQQELLSLSAINRSNLAKFHAEKKSWQQLQEAAARRSQERLAHLQKLSKQVQGLQKITRPDHEKKCPVHPAIVYAIELLRTEDPDRGADQGRADTSPALASSLP